MGNNQLLNIDGIASQRLDTYNGEYCGLIQPDIEGKCVDVHTKSFSAMAAESIVSHGLLFAYGGANSLNNWAARECRPVFMYIIYFRPDGKQLQQWFANRIRRKDCSQR